MAEPTINIPSTFQAPKLDKDKLIELNEELIEYLCNFTSSFKYSKQSPEFKKTLKEQMSLIQNLHKGKFHEVMNVMKCLKCKEREISHIISCNHGFCQMCIEDHIKQRTTNFIVLNEEETESPDNISTKCPVCNVYLTEEDLKSIFGDLTEYKNNSKLRKIVSDYEKNKKFTCFTCGKLRGSNQFMSKTCGHMCKNCFSYRGCEELKANCTTCNFKILPEQSENIKVSCTKCQKSFYMIGDFMQEVCINFLYCCECADTVVEQGYCECHKSPINYTKKIEIIRAIIRQCLNCKRESVITNFLRNSCCDNSICFNCANNSSYCLGCNKNYSNRVIQEISNYFNHI
jgi:hypothetical protein